MRKIFTLLFIITISIVSFSQTLNEKELYGKWKVEEGKSSVKIGNEEDGYTIMGNVIRNLKESKIFHLTESGINLLMSKVE